MISTIKWVFRKILFVQEVQYKDPYSQANWCNDLSQLKDHPNVIVKLKKAQKLDINYFSGVFWGKISRHTNGATINGQFKIHELRNEIKIMGIIFPNPAFVISIYLAFILLIMTLVFNIKFIIVPLFYFITVGSIYYFSYRNLKRILKTDLSLEEIV